MSIVPKAFWALLRNLDFIIKSVGRYQRFEVERTYDQTLVFEKIHAG